MKTPPITNIQRVSIVPFYVKGLWKELDRKSKSKKKLKGLSDILKCLNFKIIYTPYKNYSNDKSYDKAKDLIGLAHWKLKYKKGSLKFNIYISKQDFAIAVIYNEPIPKKYRRATLINYEGPSFSDYRKLNPNIIDVLLTERSTFHDEIKELDTEHPIAKSVTELYKEFVKNSKAISPEYAFAYFILSYAAEPGESSTNLNNKDYFSNLFSGQEELPVSEPGQEDFNKYILALASPSHFSEENRISEIVNFKWMKDLFEVKTIDIQNNILCLASWSTLVILAPSNAENEKVSYLYEQLEVRIQFAWSISHEIKKSCDDELSLNTKTGVRDEHTQNLPILATLSGKSSAKTTDRELKILKGLAETSKLKEEIEGAEKLFKYLDKREETSAGTNIARVSFVALALTFIFFVIQAFAEIPLYDLAWKIYIVVGSLILITTFLYIDFLTKTFRKWRRKILKKLGRCGRKILKNLGRCGRKIRVLWKKMAP